ncbi:MULTISPECIES: LysR family transcriptional regulator [Mammaliicoccus]|uniref:LysR family transcriptional regulator n=1 Tax=Mammaliicoccus TaxID=2803850 RepID=UPI0004511548|nr:MULTISPECIES: LysR family transcriptional regulator [Mammaliicoccus]EZX22492.1 hypothetical protein V070_01381 [Staphylococcus aureus C0673]MBF9298423.1 LysR family transcriptional regulator [Staphylococcus schleiferi]MCJ0943194.1 LysR family transcriptional regulator [Mammaliicoccus sciuri]MDO0948879.1 LysR family transcriptional regulator [Mammaliicoccus sciuri]MDO0954059.1 LysR family transcriptional regulator [Mammaliicoccus sciuri]
MNKLHAKSYLEAIVRFGNISHAAKHLYVSQPYLSKFLKDIESEVGVKLIDRESNPLTLTYAGERYLAYAEEMENISQKMAYELQEIANLEKGRLKIGVNPFLASHTLYNILPEFIKNYPGIEVELIEDSANQIEVLLAEHKIDICITILPINNEEIDYETLYTEALYLAIPDQNPLAKYIQSSEHKLPFAINKLNREKFILLKNNMTLRRVTDTFFEDHDLKPQTIVETINVDNALYLVNEGLGITVVPASVKMKSSHQNVKYFKLNEFVYKNTVAIAYNKHYDISKAASVFLNLAIMRFKER